MKWLYCWKSRGETFFNQTAFLFWCHARWKLASSNLLYFRNETCYGNGNLCKGLLFVYLQPSFDDVTVKTIYKFDMYTVFIKLCCQDGENKNRSEHSNALLPCWFDKIFIVTFPNKNGYCRKYTAVHFWQSFHHQHKIFH